MQFADPAYPYLYAVGDVADSGGKPLTVLSYKTLRRLYSSFRTMLIPSISTQGRSTGCITGSSSSEEYCRNDRWTRSGRGDCSWPCRDTFDPWLGETFSSSFNACYRLLTGDARPKTRFSEIPISKKGLPSLILTSKTSKLFHAQPVVWKQSFNNRHLIAGLPI